MVFWKWVIVAVVVLFLGLTLQRAYQDIHSHREHLDFSKIEWLWLGLGVLLYMAGLIPAGIAWLQTLKSFKQSVPFWFGMNVYLLGHLGKYVPGKAMVLVLRVGKLHPIGVEIKPTIVSIFVETLTSVCTGAILGSLLMLFQSPPRWMMLGAACTILISSILLLPHTFRAVLMLLAKSKIGRMPRTVSDAFTWRLMVRNSCWMVLGWLLHGTASWLVLCGLYPVGELGTIDAWSLCVAANALGAVVGFASMLPSGAVVRELVILGLLSKLVPQPVALCAAVLFRIGSLIAELTVIWLLSLTALAKTRPDEK